MPSETSPRAPLGGWLVYATPAKYELRVRAVDVPPELAPKPGDAFLFVDESTSEITGVRRLYQEWRLGADRRRRAAIPARGT